MKSRQHMLSTFSPARIFAAAGRDTHARTPGSIPRRPDKCNGIAVNRSSGASMLSDLGIALYGDIERPERILRWILHLFFPRVWHQHRYPILASQQKNSQALRLSPGVREVLAARLKERGVLIQLSTSAFFGKPHAHGFKIGYAFLSQTEMQQALDKLTVEIKRQLDLWGCRLCNERDLALA